MSREYIPISSYVPDLNPIARNHVSIVMAAGRCSTPRGLAGVVPRRSAEQLMTMAAMRMHTFLCYSQPLLREAEYKEDAPVPFGYQGHGGGNRDPGFSYVPLMLLSV